MLKSLTIAVATVAACFTFLTTPAPAGTPDSIPPAKEGSCDSLRGGTPGLYGLCVAYCEAQDLNEVFQAMKAGGNPGQKILANYRKKMGEGDPDMPCIVKSATECPCFNINLCPSNDFTCQLGITDVSQVFDGQACGISDSCLNSATPTAVAQDLCFSDGNVLSQVSVAVSADGLTGSCLATRTTDGLNSSNGFMLEGATAQICLDEINAYDGNGPTDGTDSMCGLGNP